VLCVFLNNAPAGPSNICLLSLHSLKRPAPLACHFYGLYVLGTFTMHHIPGAMGLQNGRSVLCPSPWFQSLPFHSSLKRSLWGLMYLGHHYRAKVT
jgi:hypothetical protein